MTYSVDLFGENSQTHIIVYQPLRPTTIVENAVDPVVATTRTTVSYVS
jgi:hypothetical protein